MKYENTNFKVGGVLIITQQKVNCRQDKNEEGA